MIIRTEVQEREYQRLTSHGRINYDCEARENPNASHEECMLVALAAQQTREMVRTTGTSNINIGDNRVKKNFLENLGGLIQSNFPRIWTNVRNEFNKAISYLGDLISRGMYWIADNIVDPIIDFLDDIFG